VLIRILEKKPVFKDYSAIQMRIMISTVLQLVPLMARAELVTVLRVPYGFSIYLDFNDTLLQILLGRGH
jgi:hypothetical protein